MYLAEIHGKLSRENENKEDILTSNVFSFFKYTDRSIFLYEFLKSLGLEVSEEDAINAKFYFWPTLAGGTEPDLVILVGDYYLLIEAKYSSGFGKETPTTKQQIIREIKDGTDEAKRLGKKFWFVAVTAHYSKPFDIEKDIPLSYQSCFRWINWHSIAFFINQMLESGLKIFAETRLLADDLYHLLLKKNLRNFEGLKALGTPKKIKGLPEHVFFEASTASYRGDFIGFLRAFEAEWLLKRPPSRIFFAAATATFRGDFIGFSQALHIGQDYRVKPAPSTLFFSVNDQKKFFHSKIVIN